MAYIHFYLPQYTLNINQVLKNILSCAGFLLLTYGIFFFNKNTPFPGPFALVPVLGGLLLIASGEAGWVNRRLLANPAMIWLGIISYPLYLWHWMLISFTRVVNGGESPIEQRYAAILMAIILSWITYKFLENPIRFRGNKVAISVALTFALLGTGLFGVYIYANSGLLNRASASPSIKNVGDIGHDEFHMYPYKYFYLCSSLKLKTESEKWKNLIRCFQSKNENEINIAIVGDSHAEQIFIGLAELLPAYNIAYYIKSGNPFVSNINFQNIFDYVIKSSSISTVIYTGWWSKIFDTPDKNLDDIYLEIDKTIKILVDSGKQIYITDDVPSFTFDARNCKYSRALGSRNQCIEDDDKFNSKYRVYIKYLEKISNEYKSVHLLRTAKFFCANGPCSMQINNELMYRDDHHLNINGSKYMAGKLLEEGFMKKERD